MFAQMGQENLIEYMAEARAPQRRTMVGERYVWLAQATTRRVVPRHEQTVGCALGETYECRKRGRRESI